MASWYGILAPAGTPQDIVRKLNADINRILQAPGVRERLTALGTEPTGGTPEQFGETIKADTARWEKVVSDAGIRVEWIALVMPSAESAFRTRFTEFGAEPLSSTSGEISNFIATEVVKLSAIHTFCPFVDHCINTQ